MNAQSIKEKDDFVRNLVQQVMSPAVSNGQVIPTVLSGSINFDLWKNRIMNFVSITRPEWREYVLTGKIQDSIAGRNLDAGDIARVVSVCDQALFLVIQHSVSDEIKEIIDQYFLNNQTANALSLVSHLRVKYSEVKVRNYIDLVSQFKSMANKGLKDQSKWAMEFSTQLIKYAGKTHSGVSSEEKVAALVLLMMNPDKIKNCLSFIGDKDVVSLNDIVTLLTDIGGNNTYGQSEIAMIAKKKKGTNNVKCYFCGENHSIHKCKKFKESNPHADVFKNKQPGKSEGTQFASFVASFFTSTDILKDGWVFDSGSSIHVCNAFDKFIELLPCEGEELTGIAGKVSIKGIGKVKINNIILNKVAFVPDMEFNLISISAATRQSGSDFVFTDDALFSVNSGQRMLMAKKVNGQL